ncbi:MAG: zinc-ribbon domain-containing protein [Polyangiaceae bacterium]
MDVRCTRCGTEYEFDDALISERGTSVRCTQCGHQFRVFPPKAKVVGPDEWVVLTSLGRRIVYRSLRELQNGIGRGEVAREDLLARGAAPPRPLGSIAELDPLFSTKSVPERKSSTLTGVAPPQPPSAASSTDASAPVQEPREHQDTWSGVAPQARPKELAELAANPSPPMRVGGAHTVIGIGTPGAAPTREPPVPMRAPEGTLGDVPSLAPNTKAFGSTHAGADAGAGLSEHGGATAGGNEPTVTESEPPTLPPPPSPRTTEPSPIGIRERAGTKLGIGADIPRARLLEMAPNTVAPQAPDELPKDVFATLLGKAPARARFLEGVGGACAERQRTSDVATTGVLRR